MALSRLKAVASQVHVLYRPQVLQAALTCTNLSKLCALCSVLLHVVSAPVGAIATGISRRLSPLSSGVVKEESDPEGSHLLLVNSHPVAQRCTHLAGDRLLSSQSTVALGEEGFGRSWEAGMRLSFWKSDRLFIVSNSCSGCILICLMTIAIMQNSTSKATSPTPMDIAIQGTGLGGSRNQPDSGTHESAQVRPCEAERANASVAGPLILFQACATVEARRIYTCQGTVLTGYMSKALGEGRSAPSSTLDLAKLSEWLPQKPKDQLTSSNLDDTSPPVTDFLPRHLSERVQYDSCERQ
ncbi:hypothetical protein EK904_009451 [Melospiza melodia maxima]|nr:hypothetical protein EK904_009451 [Melospiza melodia maxima]